MTIAEHGNHVLLSMMLTFLPATTLASLLQPVTCAVSATITRIPLSFTPHCKKCSDNHDINSVRVYDVDSQMEDAKKEMLDQPTADVVRKKSCEIVECMSNVFV